MAATRQPTRCSQSRPALRLTCVARRTRGRNSGTPLPPTAHLLQRVQAGVHAGQQHLVLIQVIVCLLSQPAKGSRWASDGHVPAA